MRKTTIFKILWKLQAVASPTPPPTTPGGTPMAAAWAARTSAFSRGHQPLIILSPERMQRTGGHQPVFILTPTRMLIACMHKQLRPIAVIPLPACYCRSEPPLCFHKILFVDTYKKTSKKKRKIQKRRNKEKTSFDRCMSRIRSLYTNPRKYSNIWEFQKWWVGVRSLQLHQIFNPIRISFCIDYICISRYT